MTCAFYDSERTTKEYTVTIYVINAPNTVIQTEKSGTWTQNQWHAGMKGVDNPDWSGGTSNAWGHQP